MFVYSYGFIILLSFSLLLSGFCGLAKIGKVGLVAGEFRRWELGCVREIFLVQPFP